MPTLWHDLDFNFLEVGVSFEDELSLDLRHTDIYNEWTLILMGYHKLDERWESLCLDRSCFDL